MDCIYVKLKTNEYDCKLYMTKIVYKPFNFITKCWININKSQNFIPSSQHKYFNNEKDMLLDWFNWWYKNRKKGILIGYNLDIFIIREMLIKYNVNGKIISNALSKWKYLDVACCLDFIHKRYNILEEAFKVNYKLKICSDLLLDENNIKNQDKCRIILKLYHLIFPYLNQKISEII